MPRDNSPYNDPYKNTRLDQLKVQVTLTCGCIVSTRNQPMNSKTKYPCPSNAGHGYNVGWTSWREGDRGGTNE